MRRFECRVWDVGESGPMLIDCEGWFFHFWLYVIHGACLRACWVVRYVLV